MNYKELNDNELVYLCAENNEEAENYLINKYNPSKKLSQTKIVYSDIHPVSDKKATSIFERHYL